MKSEGGKLPEEWIVTKRKKRVFEGPWGNAGQGSCRLDAL